MGMKTEAFTDESRTALIGTMPHVTQPVLRATFAKTGRLEDWKNCHSEVVALDQRFSSGPNTQGSERPHESPYGNALRCLDAEHVAARHKRGNVQGVAQATLRANTPGGVKHLVPAFHMVKP